MPTGLLGPNAAGDDAAPVPAEEGDTRKSDAAKHQAILSIDEATWRDIITTLGIKQPMIEHRAYEASQGPGARGWYN